MPEPPEALAPSHRAFVAVALVWLLYELGFGLLPARKGARERRRADRGSWAWMTVATTAGVLLSGGLAQARVAMAPWAGPGADVLGIALILAGFGLRLRARRELGRSFTTRVAVEANHSLVDTGPYRRVRHPAYLGDLLAFFGIGIGQGSLLSLAVLLALAVPPLLYRIRVEERALEEALGERWRAYAARTPPLLPALSRPRGPAPPSS